MMRNKKANYFFIFLLSVLLLTAAGTAVNKIYADPQLIASDGWAGNLYNIDGATGSTSLIGTFIPDC
jgi:hypothetical protein